MLLLYSNGPGGVTVLPGVRVTAMWGRDSPVNALQVSQSWAQNMDQDPKEAASASFPEAARKLYLPMMILFILLWSSAEAACSP